MTTARDVTIVIPTVGRSSLGAALAPLVGRIPVVVVDDRPLGSAPLAVPAGVRVEGSGGRGPASARNTGWRSCATGWVAFLDDDVEPSTAWVDGLLTDLDEAGPEVGGVQGRIRVPTAPAPTDWARSTKGLEAARWATADLAYRRDALEQVGGFDERFPRAFREDADLGLRITQCGWRITNGRREVTHPVRQARWWQSVRSQRGNADDALMRRLHGPDWQVLAHVPAGRRPWHVVTTAALITTLLPRLRRVAAPVWLLLVGDFARRRIAPGPRTGSEVLSMVATSVAIPPAACGWWLVGWWRARR